ncbi:pilus assembly protein TadG-related protein (plasmid) [Kitasatospora sp. NBC_00374]|uniref:pilus assembly protein TadG-related protein n=1 Tax=Kitasatospora sp. NBC_00374 TaxID=2975964 RepID=UPI002F907D2E
MTELVIRRLRRARERGAERGSGALALILAAMLFLVMAGFVIDTGRAIHEREKAADVAEQAARFAANQISAADLRNGQVVIDVAGCTGHVQDFVRASGISGGDVGAARCSAAGGNQVTVEVRLTYTPLLLPAFNGGLTVWGRATAQAVQEQ